MNDHIKFLIEHLEDMIEDTECRTTGSGSILNYGMKIRRDTAEEILRVVQANCSCAEPMTLDIVQKRDCFHNPAS